MQLIFTRHGESQANLERIISNRDLPHALTEKGRTQAMALAERLATTPIRAIYTSPILRARQSAQIIAERLALPLVISDALREFDCGIMEGRGDPAAWEAHAAITATWANGDYAAAILGGESFEAMQARFLPFVQQLLTGPHSDVSLLISHGALLHHMLPLVLSNIDAAFVAAHPLGNCACVIAQGTGQRLHCLEWAGVKL